MGKDIKTIIGAVLIFYLYPVCTMAVWHTKYKLLAL
jgi:hypothetical protein